MSCGNSTSYDKKISCCLLQTGAIIWASVELACNILLFFTFLIVSFTHQEEGFVVGGKNYRISGLGICSGGFSILFNIAIISLLLYGSLYACRWFMLPWIVITPFTIVFHIILTILTSLKHPLRLFRLICIAFLCYIWYCILMFYITLKNEASKNKGN